jgi:DNA repair protein SbcD/Mre11
VKFLHAADIHLDSALAGLIRREAVPAGILRDCTRRAFANVIDVAIAEDVAFVIIAGDLYDADWKDFSTGLFFIREMRRLGRPCILVRGNHDAASVITRGLEPPENVHVLPVGRPGTIRLDAHGVAIHGQSFPHRAVPEDLSANYPAPVAGMLNIGVLHTSAEDPGEHETYAPCSVQSLVLKGYDYWALGHIHQRRVLHERPFVVFPGNIQGRNPREAGAKGCTLVEVHDRRVTGITHHDTDVLRWAQAEADLGGAASMAEAAIRLRASLAVAAQEAAGRPLLVRLTLRGDTALHPALLADPLATDAECRAAAASVSADLHIERVRVQTRLPAQEAADTADAAEQLAGPFLAGLDDPETADALIAEFRSLAAQIPRQPGRAPPDLPQTLHELKTLAPEAWLAVARALGERA